MGRRSAGTETEGKVATENGTLELKTPESWLWDAACQIRGPLDAPKFKDYILPLIFLKRLSDVFDDEVSRVAEELGDEETARKVIEPGTSPGGRTSKGAGWNPHLT